MRESPLSQRRRWGRQGLCYLAVLLLLLIGCGKEQLPPVQHPRVLSAAQYPGVGFLDSGDSVCTGTLLSPRVVITAAHCVLGREVAALGFTLHPRPIETEPEPPYAKAEWFRVHPLYLDKDETPGVDVAVVVLKSVDYGFSVRTFLAFGDEFSLRPGRTAWNIGYGENADGTHALKRAKEVRFQAIEDLPLDGRPVVPNGIVVVTRGSAGEIGCSGDSGSPLVVLDPEGRPSIVGIYSSSESAHRVPERNDCKKGIQTGNYIGIKAFRDWMSGLPLPSPAD